MGDVEAPCFDYFYEELSRVMSSSFVIEELNTSKIPQYFCYERVKELVLFKIRNKWSIGLFMQIVYYFYTYMKIGLHVLCSIFKVSMIKRFSSLTYILDLLITMKFFLKCRHGYTEKAEFIRLLILTGIVKRLCCRLWWILHRESKAALLSCDA